MTKASSKLNGDQLCLVSPSVPEIAEQYTFWTGDTLRGLKQAEQVAWHIEDAIVATRATVGDWIGSEQSLAGRFGTGIGVMREALEILDLRGVCCARPGPGGGIFIARPSQQMTAQITVNYFLRAGVNFRQLWEAKNFLQAILSAGITKENPVLSLFSESLTQLDQCLPQECARSVNPRTESNERRLLSEVATFRWHRYAPVRFSTAKQIGLAISQAIAEGKFSSGVRIGTEWELLEQYGISHASMRQAIRLLETFGIVESRPGRGRGLFPSEPNAVPVIRAMHSYFLALRMSAEDWRTAIEIFGCAALNLVFKYPTERQVALLHSGKHELQEADTRIKVWISRQILLSVMELLENPIIMLFWRALAGYSLRAFNEAKLQKLLIGDLITRSVPEILEAALMGDQDKVVKSYVKIFPETLSNHWTI